MTKRSRRAAVFLLLAKWNEIQNHEQKNREELEELAELFHTHLLLQIRADLELYHLRQVIENEYKEFFDKCFARRSARLAWLPTIQNVASRSLEHYTIEAEFRKEIYNLLVEVVEKYPLVKHYKFGQLFRMGEEAVLHALRNLVCRLDRDIESAVWVKFDPDSFFAKYPVPNGMDRQAATNLVLAKSKKAKVWNREAQAEIAALHGKFADLTSTTTPPKFEGPEANQNSIVMQVVDKVLY